MAEIDPYATLGVPRTASRDEIARAYRALAKRYHPDAGAEPSPTMARINEAWHLLSDPNRRARWDRLHAPILAPHWSPPEVPRQPIQRPPSPPTPTTVRDSPWLAAAAVVVTALLVVAAVLATSVVGVSQQPTATVTTHALGGLRMTVPDEWTVAAGATGGGDAHRVVAHVVTFPTLDGELCTAFGEPCALAGGRIPPGQASVLVTEWSAGEPPVARPGDGLPASQQQAIGGEPAAFQLRTTADGVVAWWQLSPPGFPDRWFEVRADIGGLGLDRTRIERQVEIMVESIDFVEDNAGQMRRHLAATLRPFDTPPLAAISVRHPSPEDAEGLAALMLDAYVGTIDADGSETLDDARTEVRGYLTGAAGEPMLEHSFVALDQGRLVSACLVSCFEDTPLVAYAMTAADHKGRGLATALTSRSLGAMHAAGERRVHLWVTAGNAPAETLYERLGFRDVALPGDG